MRLRILLVIVAFLFCVSLSAPTIFAQNLLTNGSFETGDFTGWTTGGNFQYTQVVSGPSYPYGGAQDGNFYVTMGPVNSDGTLSQSLATSPGSQYTISFWFAAVGDYPSDFSVYWNNTQLLSLSNPNTGANWTLYTAEVTATGCDTLLFSFRDDPGYMALDNISVTGPRPYECVHDVPQNGFTIIHNFTGNQQSPAPGLALDHAGELYGTTGSGGDNGSGLAYKLGTSGQDWMFTPLYSFPGGPAGQNPLPGVIGPEGALYGTADGGLQQCGSSGNQYCGLVYRLRPSPHACLTALCSWTETVVYRFAGDPDGWEPNGNVVFDQAGNLYGTTLSGGANGRGTVYELTPSNGGWTEQVIYSFTANDGDGPSSLLMGKNGNLYGTTFVGGHGGGVVFQLAPAGGSWTEQVVASFAPCTSYYGCSPVLVQEDSGKLYGIDPYDIYLCPPGGCLWNEYATIFTMSPSDGGWQVTILDDTRNYWFGNWLDPTGYDLYYDLTIDAAGNLYSTEGGYAPGFGGPYYWGNIYKVLWPQQEDRSLVWFGGNDFRDLEVDASGKLYGTTGSCRSSQGSVWQLTPQP